jgi:ferredoxin-NADP reductase
MALEIINWWQDVREHLNVSKRRKRLQQAGRGEDYTGDEYRDTVQRVISRIHPPRMRLRVTGIIHQTPTAKTFHLERVDGPLPSFRAGQYLNLFVEIGGIRTSRPYSIASPPPGFRKSGAAAGHNRHALELTVRHKPTGFVSSYLFHSLEKGDQVESTGPSGSFYYEPLIDGQDLVFLAGGSGITPFMSMIRERIGTDASLRIHLLYGNRSPEEIIYHDELTSMAQGYGNFSYSPVISEPPAHYEGLSGFLDARLIGDQVGEVTGKTFYICGPGAMYDLCLNALGELGVPLHRIRMEHHGPPDDITKAPGWPAGVSGDEVFDVVVEGRDAIRAPAAEPLLNTLERNGMRVPVLCRSGACSACRIRLLAGRVFMPAHTGLRESDRIHGYIHACASYPLEDLRIRL